MIGIVAHEFPPHLGGMQQHAWGLAQALNEIEPVIVYTSTAAAGSGRAGVHDHRLDLIQCLR